MLSIAISIPDHMAKRLTSTPQEVAYYRKSLIVTMFNDGDLSVDEARQLFNEEPGETTFEEFWGNSTSMAMSGPYTKDMRDLVSTDD